jgi:hypothetical protein
MLPPPLSLPVPSPVGSPADATLGSAAPAEVSSPASAAWFVSFAGAGDEAGVGPLEDAAPFATGGTTAASCGGTTVPLRCCAGSLFVAEDRRVFVGDASLM